MTLAYPLLGYPPDSTIDLVEPLARRLVREGRARPADSDVDEMPAAVDRPGWTPEEIRSLRRLTVAELHTFAQQHQIDLGTAARRKEILALIEATSIPAG